MVFLENSIRNYWYSDSMSTLPSTDEIIEKCLVITSFFYKPQQVTCWRFHLYENPRIGRHIEMQSRLTVARRQGMGWVFNGYRVSSEEMKMFWDGLEVINLWPVDVLNNRWIYSLETVWNGLFYFVVLWSWGLAPEPHTHQADILPFPPYPCAFVLFFWRQGLIKSPRLDLNL